MNEGKGDRAGHGIVKSKDLFALHILVDLLLNYSDDEPFIESIVEESRQKKRLQRETLRRLKWFHSSQLSRIVLYQIN